MSTTFQVMLQVNLILQGEVKGYAMQKITLPFAPSQNIELQHQVWHSARKPNRVAYSISDARFFVQFEDPIDSQEDLSAKVQMYQDGKWAVELN
jgi:hypothetical protein